MLDAGRIGQGWRLGRLRILWSQGSIRSVRSCPVLYLVGFRLHGTSQPEFSLQCGGASQLTDSMGYTLPTLNRGGCIPNPHACGRQCYITNSTRGSHSFPYNPPLSLVRMSPIYTAQKASLASLEGFVFGMGTPACSDTAAGLRSKLISAGRAFDTVGELLHSCHQRTSRVSLLLLPKLSQM